MDEWILANGVIVCQLGEEGSGDYFMPILRTSARAQFQNDAYEFVTLEVGGKVLVSEIIQYQDISEAPDSIENITCLVRTRDVVAYIPPKTDKE